MTYECGACGRTYEKNPDACECGNTVLTYAPNEGSDIDSRESDIPEEILKGEHLEKENQRNTNYTSDEFEGRDATLESISRRMDSLERKITSLAKAILRTDSVELTDEEFEVLAQPSRSENDDFTGDEHDFLN